MGKSIPKIVIKLPDIIEAPIEGGGTETMSADEYIDRLREKWS